jgi:hypothetical protein
MLKRPLFWDEGSTYLTQASYIREKHASSNSHNFITVLQKIFKGVSNIFVVLKDIVELNQIESIMSCLQSYPPIMCHLFPCVCGWKDPGRMKVK